MSRHFKLFVLVTIAYVFFIFEYIMYMQGTIHVILIKLPDFDAIGDNYEFVYGYIFSLIPLIWIRFRNRVADIVYMFIYITVIIPSMMFLINNKNIEFSNRIYFSLFILFSFLVTHLVTYAPPFQMRLSPSSRRVLWVSLLIATVGLSGYFLISNPDMLKNVQLFDVYEKRLEIREAIQTGSRSRISSYLANWLGTAIAPFLGVVGYRKKNVFLIILALAVAYISFGISSQKTAFFSLIIALSFVVFALFIRSRSRRNVDISLIVAFVLIFGYSVAPFVVDWIWFQESNLTFKVSFRLFHNNGYLTSVYYDLFKDQPNLYYADSFLSGLIDSPFSQSYSRMAGDYISNYDAQNNANANYIADGYVNAGLFGILFSSIQLGLVIWIFDSLSRNKDPILAATILIPICIVFSNISIHTGLLSNGGLVSMFLLLLLPDETPSRWTGIRAQRNSDLRQTAGPSILQTERPT